MQARPSLYSSSPSTIQAAALTCATPDWSLFPESAAKKPLTEDRLGTSNLIRRARCDVHLSDRSKPQETSRPDGEDLP
jgi:hypothetical protein